ncbi:DNA ligase 1 [Tanacetum coccineum]
MLASPTKGVSEILDKFQNMEFTCEYKYDGERAQIHYLEDGTVHIYSRRYAGKEILKILDVRWLLFLKILRTRARKNVIMSEIKVEVCIYAFDLLYLNGEQLLQEQLCTRRQRTWLFPVGTAIRINCEGLIIKTLTRDATYEPAKRSNNWLKLKKDYIDSIGDSLDLVPIAAFEGRGKRAGCYGAFLLACYAEIKMISNPYEKICFVQIFINANPHPRGSGLSDDTLEERSTSLRSKEIPKPKAYYRYKDIKPDAWFEATELERMSSIRLELNLQTERNPEKKLDRCILSRRSPWTDIIREFDTLSRKGIDIHSHVKKEAGNGEHTSFWDDVWLTESPLKHIYPRLFALECDKHASVAGKFRDPSLIASFRRAPRGDIEE